MAIKTILLDVGGTFIKCSDERSIPVDSNGSREEIISSLRTAVGDADEIAVAIPGPFNYETGQFLMKHKFATVYGEYFPELCGRPNACFHFIHDVNGMLQGELSTGAGKNYSNVALVTLGTGLGFSMAVNHQILKNENGSPLRSIYNLPYGNGILEDLASKRGILNAYGGDASLTVKDVAEFAFHGDSKAIRVFEHVGEVIADTIRPLLYDNHIQCLLFGGQISRSFSLIQSTLQTKLADLNEMEFVGRVSDIDNATFNGLRSLLEAN